MSTTLSLSERIARTEAEITELEKSVQVLPALKSHLKWLKKMKIQSGEPGDAGQENKQAVDAQAGLQENELRQDIPDEGMA